MPPRRSKRKKIAVDYARLDETGVADSSKLHYRRLTKLLLKYPETAGGGSSLAVLTPRQLSKYVHSTGFRFPCVVRGSSTAVQELGMRLPEIELTVKHLAEMVGLERQIRTIDVDTQLEGPIYTMEEWVDYFYSRNPKKQLLNVVSLDLSSSPVQDMVRIPTLVKELDLIEKAWPQNVLPIPQVQLYALMSVANCFMDFHLDFGGSSVWYHVISGCKVFLLVPPTRENLIMFEEWASSEKQSSVFFGDRASGCHKLQLSAGDTLFLPGGWPHSVVTPVDSLVLGGNFLTGYNLSLQFEIWNMEERMKVRPKFRFPMYKQLMWMIRS